MKPSLRSCSCWRLAASTSHLCLSACSAVGRSSGLGCIRARMNALASSDTLLQYLLWLCVGAAEAELSGRARSGGRRVRRQEDAQLELGRPALLDELLRACRTERDVATQEGIGDDAAVGELVSEGADEGRRGEDAPCGPQVNRLAVALLEEDLRSCRSEESQLGGREKGEKEERAHQHNPGCRRGSSSSRCPRCAWRCQSRR